MKKKKDGLEAFFGRRAQTAVLVVGSGDRATIKAPYYTIKGGWVVVTVVVLPGGGVECTSVIKARCEQVEQGAHGEKTEFVADGAQEDHEDGEVLLWGWSPMRNPLRVGRAGRLAARRDDDGT